MASPQQKLVKVGDDIVAFPSNMENDRIAKLVKSFHEKKKIQPVATEESEHTRQLKDAQPLGTAIPSIPDWTNKPLVSDEDLEETPQGKALTAKSQKEFETAHPKITAAINKGNNPVVLGALSGANEFAKSMTSPANMALMLGAPESKILSGIFSVQALRGSYKDAQSAKKSFDEGKNEEAIKYVTQALLGAGVGALAGTHAYKGLPEGIRTRLASEEGGVPLPLKPTTAYQAVDQSQPFYLKSENLINEKMKGPMPAEDVHKMLLSNGVKPEEMQWTGLDELLKAKGKSKVTPQEIQEHLAGNNLQVKEVFKGHPKPTQWTDHHNGVLTTPEGYKIERLDSNGKYIATSNSGIRQPFDTLDEAKNKVDSWRKSSSEDEVTPKFSSYQLPGGTNYRELLIAAPNIGHDMHYEKLVADWRSAEKASYDYMEKHRENLGNPDPALRGLYDQVKQTKDALDSYKTKKDKESPNGVFRPQQNDFTQGHWDEPNVLGHVRFNDRVGPNGEKILHLEELQSDWAQKGRKQGFAGEQPKYTSLPEGYVLHEMGSFRNPDGKQYWVQGPDRKQFTSAGFNKESAINEAINRLNDEDRARRGQHGSPVPNMPFKKTWPELMLKRMIQYAATHGYDGVSWTPGEEQAERYSLDKHLSRISYNPETQTLYAADLDGRSAINERVPPEKLPDTIGKETTEKLLATERQQDPLFKKEKTYQLSGSGLKVESTGMRGFYDKIIPDAANKLGKQWGAKVGEMRLGAPQSTIDALKQEADAKYEVWSKLKNDAERHTGYIYGSPESSAVDEAYDAWGEALDKYKEAKTRPEYKVPYLPLHPQMRAGIKSVPYSLFAATGAALGLQAVKEKAKQLQDEFRKAGLSQ